MKRNVISENVTCKMQTIELNSCAKKKNAWGNTNKACTCSITRYLELTSSFALPCLHTVELRFNEVPRDRVNLFVISRVRYIENLDITNLRKNKQNIRYIEV